MSSTQQTRYTELLDMADMGNYSTSDYTYRSSVVTIFLGAPTILSNAFLLLVLVKVPRLHSSVNTLMASLCCVGVIVGVNLAVWSAQDVIATHLPLCITFSCFNVGVFLVTLFHIGAIGVNRYFYFVHPFKHERLSQNRRVTASVLLTLWLGPLALSALPGVFTIIDGLELEENTCLFLAAIGTPWLLCVLYIGAFVFVSIITFVSYFRIVMLIRQHLLSVVAYDNSPETIHTISHGQDNSGSGSHVHFQHLNHDHTPSYERNNGNIKFDDTGLSTTQSVDVVTFPLSTTCLPTPDTSNTEQQEIPNTCNNNRNRNVIEPVRYASVSKRKSRGGMWKAVKPFFILFLYFFISWTPNLVVKLVVVFHGAHVAPRVVVIIVNMLTAANPLGNIGLYLMAEKEVRGACIQFLVQACRRREN